MSVNMRLLTARTRDRQTRGLRDFLTACQDSVGIPASEIQIVDPETTAHVVNAISSHIQDGIAAGAISRQNELTWDQVVTLLDLQISRWQNVIPIVFLSHYEDFLLRLPFASFVENLQRLLSFDGDTIYCVSSDLQMGFGVDIYPSELIHATRFAVDTL